MNNTEEKMHYSETELKEFQGIIHKSSTLPVAN